MKPSNDHHNDIELQCNEMIQIIKQIGIKIISRAIIQVFKNMYGCN